MEGFQLDTNWEDVTCPICLAFPHNGVLLRCSSYNKGCRPFVCDTNHLHSNCLARFQTANGMLSSSDLTSSKSLCPLCRGDVTGWDIVNEARSKFDSKKRYCEDEKCSFFGTYMELQKHAQLEHPHTCPSKIDPARQLDWENFQQSSEIIDVLTTIHSEVPRGVVLGDYVIEYGDNDSGDESENFPRGGGNWWTSCILFQVFANLRSCRNRRRLRASGSRRGSRRLSYDDDGSVVSIEFSDSRADEAVDEFVTRRHRSSRRRPFCFYEN